MGMRTMLDALEPGVLALKSKGTVEVKTKQLF